MKLNILILTLALALTSMAQTTASAPPSSSAPDAKACACCNHDQAGNGAKADGCKDGKCPMMSGSHAAMKCPMMSGNQAAMKCPMMAKDGKMADGKMCCSSNKCPMHAKGNKGGCCCGNMGEPQPAGM